MMNMDQYTDAFLESMLHGFIQVWFVWVFVALLFAGYLTYGLYRWRLIAGSGLKDIDAMSGRDFERYLEILFSKLGFRVQQTAARGDFGADLVASSRGERVVIQAKRYRRNVGVRAVQEAVAAKGYYSCDKAMVVTNSLFTRQAATLAHRNHVTLWDRYRLAKAMASIGGRRAISQATGSDEPASSQASMLSVDAQTSGSTGGAICAVCGQRVSEKVRDYCLANKRRFAGQILCYTHQRTR
jgi:restriction system protein